MKRNKKSVQTFLTKEEYEVFKEVLAKKHVSTKEGLRVAVLRLITEELNVDSNDPFSQRVAAKGSGVGDLSTHHDKYLYGKSDK